MSLHKNDFSELENALMSFFGAIKKPSNWSNIVDNVGINLDRSAVAVLHSLDERVGGEKSCNVQDLAKRLNIEAPSVTRKTQELEALGLIKRSKPAADKRVTIINITSEGRKITQKLWDERNKVLKNIINDWSSADRKKFAELLQKFADGLNQASTIKKGKQL